MYYIMLNGVTANKSWISMGNGTHVYVQIFQLSTGPRKACEIQMCQHACMCILAANFANECVMYMSHCTRWRLTANWVSGGALWDVRGLPHSHGQTTNIEKWPRWVNSRLMRFNTSIYINIFGHKNPEVRPIHFCANTQCQLPMDLASVL